MRIGINGRFLAAPLTGVQRFARELTAALAERTDIILLAPANADMPAFSPATVRVGILRGQAWEQIELPRTALGLRCDVVLHPANSVPLAGTRNVVMVHDVLPLTDPQWFSPLYAFWHRRVMARSIAGAAHVLAPTSWVAGEVARECRVPAERISVITQGLEPFGAPATDLEIEQVRRRFALHGNYLLAVGDGDPRKNIEFLLPVVSALRTSADPMLELAIVAAKRGRAHTASQVEWPAWVRRIIEPTDAELRALYTGARTLCFPSRAEGFGRPPLEALSCGTPAVVSGYAAAHEVFGSAVPLLPLETKAWVEVLTPLLSRFDARSAAVQSAQPLLSGYTWDRCADQVVQACQRAIRGLAEVTV